VSKPELHDHAPRFFSVQDDLIDSIAATINPLSTLVYIALKRYALQKDSCYPSQTTLAAKLNMSRHSVMRALAELEEHGLIRREKRFGKGGAQLPSTIHILWRPVVKALPNAQPRPLQLPPPSHTATPPVAHSDTEVNNVEVNNISNSTVPDGTAPLATNGKHEPEPVKVAPQPHDVVVWWQERTGTDAERLANKSRVYANAKSLLTAGVKIEELEDLYAYCARWMDGVDLGGMLAQLNKYRAFKAAPPPGKLIVPGKRTDPVAAARERLELLESGRWKEIAKERQAYGGANGATNLARDIKALRARLGVEAEREEAVR
jgi:hypothetical protein